MIFPLGRYSRRWSRCWRTDAAFDKGTRSQLGEEARGGGAANEDRAWVRPAETIYGRRRNMVVKENVLAALLAAQGRGIRPAAGGWTGLSRAAVWEAQ